MSSISVKEKRVSLKKKFLERVLNHTLCQAEHSDELIAKLSRRLAFLQENVCDRQKDGAVRELYVFLRAIEIDELDLDDAHAGLEKSMKAFHAFMSDNKDVKSQALRKLNLREKEAGNNLIWKDKAGTQARDAETGEEISGLGEALEARFGHAARSTGETVPHLDRFSNINPLAHSNIFWRNRASGGPDDLILPS